MNHAKLLPLFSLLLLPGCPVTLVDDGAVGEDEIDASTENDSTSNTDTTGDTDTEGGCPVGVEGCPCTDASTCFPSLECVDDLCVPADPCPIGEAGCPCTNFGTCDAGSVCTDGVCECTTGELGCECLAGWCDDALDCVDGLCSIPELVSEAANGWGPVTCWYPRGQMPINLNSCFAARGDVVHSVIPACEVAEWLTSKAWFSSDTWVASSACADGVLLPTADAPWDEVGCFVIDEIGSLCIGRIGHLWTYLSPECVIPVHEFEPWGTIDSDCIEGTPIPAPVNNDVDEWRCGFGENDIGCLAKYGSNYAYPYPPCLIDPETAYLAEIGYELHDGWGLFKCE
jgi:hypothetical protein